MDRIFVLKGEKISLVVPDKKDAIVWNQGIANLENALNLISVFGTVNSIESSEKFYDKQTGNPDNNLFSIYLNSEKRVIGNVSLRLDFKNRNGEIGILISDLKDQSRGNGTEALSLILAYGFNYLGLHKITLKLVGTNKRAYRAYQKVGFVEIGKQEDQLYIGGEYRDLIFMEIMRKNYVEKMRGN